MLLKILANILNSSTNPYNLIWLCSIRNCKLGPDKRGDWKSIRQIRQDCRNIDTCILNRELYLLKLKTQLTINYIVFCTEANVYSKMYMYLAILFIIPIGFQVIWFLSFRSMLQLQVFSQLNFLT